MFSKLLSRVAEWGRGRANGKVPFTYTITGPDGSSYLTRMVFPRIFGVRPMLHHFHRPDQDREPHNHPWSWAFSFVLSGSYTEERVHLGWQDVAALRGGVVRIKSPVPFTWLVKWWNFLRNGSDFHRITELHGDVWTLFIAGPHVSDWGFLRDGKFIPHERFLDERPSEVTG